MMPDLRSLTISDQKFWQLCVANPELRLERTAEGEVIIMPPASSDTGARNSEVTGQLWLWNRKTGLGKVFDSSAGFILPNGAIRSPDSAWIHKKRWDALTRQEQSRFALICPDFVVELRSHSDRLADIQDKMTEYLENGARLGWLIDPQAQQVYIYQPGHALEVLDDPETVSGDPVLPGFVLELDGIFT
ncbi:MAG TPA: Uma2 family endonuclease [Caldilineaceae bacterium]|nr:Uma2 family endonuclease [Caldilineaceae bacterium]